MRVAAVVLAAGLGTRFGAGPGAKLLADCGGVPLVERAIAAAAASGLPVIVVQGAVDLSAVGARHGALMVPNPAHRQGLATSLAAGIDAARSMGCDAVVVGLGDQPGVPPATWAALAATDAALAVASYAGRRGNPVRIGASVWPCLPVCGDEGARRLLAERADLVVEVPSEGSPADVDEPADLVRWTT